MAHQLFYKSESGRSRIPCELLGIIESRGSVTCIVALRTGRVKQCYPSDLYAEFIDQTPTATAVPCLSSTVPEITEDTVIQSGGKPNA